MDTWTDAEVRELVSLWPNASAAQIAGTLQRSKSSICRKVQRLQQAGALPRNVMKHFKVVPVKARPHRHRIMPPPPSLDDRLDMQPCLLLELDDNRCHWPLGNIDEPTMLFCGGSAAPRHHYCTHHLRLARGSF